MTKRLYDRTVRLKVWKPAQAEEARGRLSPIGLTVKEDKAARSIDVGKTSGFGCFTELYTLYQSKGEFHVFYRGYPHATGRESLVQAAEEIKAHRRDARS